LSISFKIFAVYKSNLILKNYSTLEFSILIDKIKIYFEKRDLKFQNHKRIEKDEYPKA